MISKINKHGLLSNKDYHKLLSGQLLAHFADSIMQIALIAWIIQYLDIAGKEIASVFFFFLLPQFVLSPFTGAIADKFDRKKILVISNIYRGLIVLFIAYLIKFVHFDTQNFHYCMGLIDTLAFMLGLGYTFFYSAKMPAMTNVVESSQLKLANTINSGFINFINIFGVAVAGYAIIKTGLLGLILATAAIYLAASVLFGLMKLKYQQTYRTEKNVLTDIITALRYLKRHKAVLQVILLSVSISLIIGIFINELNTLTIDYYKLGIGGVTKFRVMLGIGIILGMLVTVAATRAKRIYPLWAGGFGAIAAVLLSAKYCTTMLLAWFWLIPFGIANVVIMVMIDTFLQKSVPDRVRGKVFGLQLTLNTLAFLLGAYTIMTANILPITMYNILGFSALIITLLVLSANLFKGNRNR